jgi:hypothetical protein
MKKLICSECKSEYGIPDSLYECAARSANVPFYCSYGHAQHFPREQGDIILERDYGGKAEIAEEEIVEEEHYEDNVIKLVINNEPE